MGRLGGMYDRQDLVSRLQDEIRTWDEELATANDRPLPHTAGHRQVTEGSAARCGCPCASDSDRARAHCNVASPRAVDRLPL